MAGCCPATPPSSVIGGAFNDANGPESDIRQGESVECYMARGGNTTGLQDDATGNALNKIANTSIPLTRSTTSASVNVQFKLTEGSTATVSSWTMQTDSTVLTLNGDTLTGTWNAGHAELGKTFKVLITANTDVDSRTFIVVPTVGGSGDEIRLISPLPGAIVNSKFGPRMHPIQNVMKPHTGIDMKYADRSVKDVVAAADGEVVLCGGNPSSGYGLRVWIKHTTAGGKHLCTTTYNHLPKIYVGQGQKVMAGQKIGLEGSTGASTGNHLHFEVKLPDGKFVDPEPLINGTLQVATSTLANGDAGTLETKNSTASMTSQEADAKSNSCEPFGPTYPAANPPESTGTVPSGLDAFESAWFFTMQREVGPFWTTAYPDDPEVAQGLIETKAQRKKVGYVNSATDPGGETKFGVAQRPNPGIAVRSIVYDKAKETGYNNYWKNSKVPCEDKSKRISVMLFDMCYLHGQGNARKIYENSGITSTLGDDDNTQLAQLDVLNAARVAFINSIPRPEYTKGWLKRAAECLAYCKAL
jgi:hypothetical protein